MPSKRSRQWKKRKQADAAVDAAKRLRGADRYADAVQIFIDGKPIESTDVQITYTDLKGNHVDQSGKPVHPSDKGDGS